MANITLAVRQSHRGAPWLGEEGRWNQLAPHSEVRPSGVSDRVSLLLARAQGLPCQGGVVPLLQPPVPPMEGRKGEGMPGRVAGESGPLGRNPGRPDEGVLRA